MNDKSFAFYVGGNIDSATIDKEQGVIPGVRIISEGPAIGHGVTVDEKTIDQLLTCSASYSTGVKVKLDHEGGSKDIVGWVNNFEKCHDENGWYLKGDLHLIKSHPSFEYVLELASTIPDTFGLSVFFTGKPDKEDGETFARCTKLLSCDIVTEPAANPTGMFSIGPITRTTLEPEEKCKVDKPKNNMDEETLHAALNKWAEKMGIKTNAPVDGEEADADMSGPEIKKTSHLKPDGSKSETIEKHHPAPKAEVDDEDDKEEMAAKFATKVTSSVMKSLASSGIRLPSVKTGDTDVTVALKSEDNTVEKFEDICVRLREVGLNGKKFSAPEAVAHAVRKFPKAHEDFLLRSQEDTPNWLKQQEMQRNGKEFSFSAKAEHWKVQGLEKPETL